MKLTYAHQITLLVTTACITCGFTWGKTDPCAEATKAVKNLSLVVNEEERTSEEKRIRKLCPGGAADTYLEALHHEGRGEVEEAVAGYRRVLRADPDFAEAHGNLGVLLARQGADDEASAELTRALMSKPDSRYHRALAEIVGQKKLYGLSAFHYEQALASFPDDIESRAGLATAYMGLGQYEKAEREYMTILRAKPEDMSTLLQLAVVYRKADRSEKALAVLKEAAGKAVANRDVHRMLGEIYQERNDHDAARREFALAGIDIEVKPEDHLRQGNEFLAAGEYRKAIAAYRSVALARPDDAEAFVKMGEAYVAAGDYEPGIDAYRKAVELKGPGEQLHYNLGVLYERKGMLDEAAEQYLKALQYTPDNGDARRRLADIYFLRGSFTKAADQYRELLRTRKDNPLLHLKLGSVYEMSKKFPEAIAEYEQAVKLDPDNLKAHKDLARLLAERGLHERAETQYRKVLRLKNDDEETRLALIALYVKKKKYDDLFILLKEAVELHPQDPNSHYKLGIMYEFRKDFSSAITAYEKVVSLDQGHAKGLNALGRLYLGTGRLKEAQLTLLAAKKANPQLDEPTLLLNRIKHELAPEPVKAKKKKKAVKTQKVKKPKVKKPQGKTKKTGKTTSKKQTSTKKPSNANR